jgi:hypothetical protein
VSEAQTAKDTLELAIRNYYTAVEPDLLVTSWVLVTHAVSDNLDDAGKSVVAYLTPTGQVYPMTTGLLTVAVNASLPELA